MQEWFFSKLQESLGNLDMSRVVMCGQGPGASIAILASAVDPRIKVLDALLGWSSNCVHLQK
jgi:cephalosporin-C deacetylase-like acetyl esterase